MNWAYLISLAGPLLVTEATVYGFRRAGDRLRGYGEAQINLGCAMLTLLILFGWPIAIIMVLTAMVTTNKKGD